MESIHTDTLKNDKRWMEVAIKLAARGRTSTLPNPMVGCVIVYRGEIISEGWHEGFGLAHAEVNALNKIPDFSKNKLKQSTVYVTLEPCCHFGKTPPCVDLLIDRGVGRVVTAMEDPNPKVKGGGHSKLREAGIEVVSGICKDESVNLNRKFIHLQSSDLPYIILKWAQSSDGFIDPDVSPKMNRGSFPITSKETRVEVHKLRSENQGILIGRRTALIDNPSLTVRETDGPNPVRIILDPKRKLNLDNLKMLEEDGKTWILCNKDENLSTSSEFEVLPWLGDKTEVWLEKLRNKGIYSLLIEGGANTLNNFIMSGLWNEAEVFSSPLKLENGLTAPRVVGKLEISLVGTDFQSHYLREE